MVAEQILARYASAQVTAIGAHVACVRQGDQDAVHNMRVAVRRLRSTLKTFQPVLGAPAVDQVRAELQWLGAALGRVRDAQVMSERLIAAVKAEPPELVIGPVVARIRSALAADIAGALEALTHELDDPRFAALLTALDRLVVVDLVQQHRASTLRRLAGKALRRADRRLAAADAADDAHRDRALHDARRAYKRARYAIEALQPSAGRPASRLVRRLTAVQDVLGAQHDTVGIREQLRRLGMQAQLGGENAFSYGLLHGRQRETAAQELASLPKVARRASRRKTRRWLDR